MASLTHVPISPLSFERFESVLEPETWRQFSEAAKRSRELLDRRVVWNLNSTARGGGVAEMLVSLLAYARGVGVDARWEVIEGNDDFFRVTKRIHNNLHGSAGDGGPLDAAEREIYEHALEGNARELRELVRPEDIVILHDPQTAGLIPALREIGAPLIWRCHVGVDVPNDRSRAAWRFLTPYVSEADAAVFSREAFEWEALDRSRLLVIAPSIDAFSAKNQQLDEQTVEAILSVAGLSEDGATGDPVFLREDGSPERVHRRAEIMEDRPLRPDDPVVLQVSRWDRLKDPLGVIDGFVEHVAPQTDAHLVYAGPAVEAVADDPEGADVLREAQERWSSLPPQTRERVHLVALPMHDLEENAAIVNALQRRASVVVQKSIAEGFGLTVAEGMWKARPVVASKIGGIQDQIEHRRSGLLVSHPEDLAEYGTEVRELLSDPEGARRMGEEAQRRVRERFLGVRSLLQYQALFERLLEAREQNGG